MIEATQFDIILRLFEQLGVEVRQERLGGAGGGLCQLRGRRVVFVDLDADAATRIDRCIKALATVPEASSVFVNPNLREQIDMILASKPSEAQ